jgi:RNA polymerase sigma factor (sigma-70 family)
LASQSEYAALVAAVAHRRDREAFARLFDYYAPRLEAYLLRLGTSPTVAEEIAQEAMVTLWRKAALFDPNKSSLATWLYRIARNRRIDLARRDRLDFVEFGNPALDAAEEPHLDRQIDGYVREEAVRMAIATLPEEQLSLVRMAFFEGLSHAQIAQHTGLPLGTVKSRLRLAFVRLRRTLEADGVVEVDP